MQILEDYPLKPLNSFGIAASAAVFAPFVSLESLEELLLEKSNRGETALPLLVLGGGSNVLFRKNWTGWVLKNEVLGIDLLHEDNQYVFVRAGAGENWHSFVLYSLERGWGGLENLSLIPGNVGASPMQNIGAYGVEIKDVFWSLEAFHIHDRVVQTFSLEDCDFGYRESIFKKNKKGEYIILNVTYRLSKFPVLNTSYGAIQQELDKAAIIHPTVKDVSDAVIRIRRSKLPDPAVIGNAGSFFKNPSIPEDQFMALKEKFPTIVGYPLPEGQVKIAAGWLIEQCGWKGYRDGDAGCHPQQALVLVNYGNASGNDIYALSTKILESVQEKFAVTLEREVNILGD